MSLFSSRLWLKGIFRIVSASKGKKATLSKSALHHFMLESIKEETIGNSRMLLEGETTL